MLKFAVYGRSLKTEGNKCDTSSITGTCSGQIQDGVRPNGILKNSGDRIQPEPPKKSLPSILSRRNKYRNGAAKRSQSAPRCRTVSFRLSDDDNDDEEAKKRKQATSDGDTETETETAGKFSERGESIEVVPVSLERQELVVEEEDLITKSPAVIVNSTSLPSFELPLVDSNQLSDSCSPFRRESFTRTIKKQCQRRPSELGSEAITSFCGSDQDSPTSSTPQDNVPNVTLPTVAQTTGVLPACQNAASSANHNPKVLRNNSDITDAIFRLSQKDNGHHVLEKSECNKTDNSSNKTSSQDLILSGANDVLDYGLNLCVKQAVQHYVQDEWFKAMSDSHYVDSEPSPDMTKTPGTFSPVTTETSKDTSARLTDNLDSKDRLSCRSSKYSIHDNNNVFKLSLRTRSSLTNGISLNCTVSPRSSKSSVSNCESGQKTSSSSTDSTLERCRFASHTDSDGSSTLSRNIKNHPVSRTESSSIESQINLPRTNTAHSLSDDDEDGNDQEVFSTNFDAIHSSKNCSRLLRGISGSLENCRNLPCRSSGSSRTSDLSSMSHGSSQRSGHSKGFGENSYLADSPSQDSSSGIASDDHNTASAASECSPTYDLLESRAKVNLLKSRYPGASRRHSERDVVDGNYGKGFGTSSNRSSDGQDYGYHETNLDDPESDNTFVFSPSPGRHVRGRCESAPTYATGQPPQRHHHLRESIGPGIQTHHRHSDKYPGNGGIRNGITAKYHHHRSGSAPIKPGHRVSYFEILPDDLVVQIFKHLSTDQLCRNARVCRRWYSLAWDPLLWTCIRINDSRVDVDKAIRTLTKRLSFETPTVCAIVEKINLSGCEKLTDKGLYTIARRCPELRHLDLQGCSGISNIALFEVVSSCVNMEYLNVAGCSSVTCICLTPEATMQAAKYGKQVYLRHLDMTDCHNLEDSGLQIIASYCNRLTYVYLRRCSKLTDVGIQYIASYCTNLREFSISDCHSVTDFGLRELSRLGPNLRYLSVAKCEKISDVGIRYIARYCTRLRYLNARGCEAVSDDSVEMLARCCSRLRSLDVGKCDVTDDGLESLAQYCKHLRKLSLKSCEGITDKGLILLAQNCRELQQLNIQDCNVTVDAYRMIKRCCKRCIIEHTNPSFY